MRRETEELCCKRFSHGATRARCASHYEQHCCIFSGSYEQSFYDQRSHGVRDAPSHGNSQERVHDTPERASPALSIKQREGVEPYGRSGAGRPEDSVAFILQICYFPPGGN